VEQAAIETERPRKLIGESMRRIVVTGMGSVTPLEPPTLTMPVKFWMHPVKGSILITVSATYRFRGTTSQRRRNKIDLYSLPSEGHLKAPKAS
jgi:hypothetical protein